MSEITYSYIIEYLRSLHTPSCGTLFDIERKIACKEEQWPIIKPEVADFIQLLLTIHRPIDILEIGTAVGYSSLLMSQYLPSHGHITTIERFPYMCEIAKENIAKSNKQNQITLLEGDAANILPTLSSASFDMIFMDCAKGQYIHFLPECIRLLRKNGLLITDNVLHKGSVARSRYMIDRRQRTTHARLRDFLWSITHNEELVSSIVPIGDGVALSFKKGE